MSLKFRPAAAVRIGLIAGFPCVMGMPALAEEAKKPTPEPKVEEIVVTATGYGEKRKTHPSNISKISGDEIDFVKAAQPAALLNRAPGVDIQQGSGVEHLTAIRSPVLTGTAGAGSFLFLEDGVPMRAAGFANVNELMDAMTEEAGAIEIVRGPGSALYGSNAEHGLINVLSRVPSDVPETELTGIIGPHGVRELDGTASTTIADGNAKHGLRASFALKDDGGFRDNSGYGQQKGQLRYDYTAPDTSVRTTVTTMNLNQETAGYVLGPNAYKLDDVRTSNPNPEAYRDAWAIRAASRIERDLGDGQKLSLTPYMRTNGMNFLMHFQPGKPVEENGHWSGGLLSSYALTLTGGHQIIFGVDTEYTDGVLKEAQTGPTVPGPAGYVTGTHYDYDVKALVVAPYLHTVWKLDEATDLTAGLRYEFTRYDYTNNTATGTTGRFLRPASRRDTFSNPTPKLGLTHIFSDAFIGFANLARSARAPQTADLYRLVNGQDPSAIKSEVLDSAELGARGTIDRLRYEVSTYFMKKRNFAFRDSSGGNITDGRTKHMGVEAEVATPLAWNFDLGASVSYAHHTYDFNHLVTKPPYQAETIRSGDDIDTAPHTVADVRLGYSFNEGLGRAELEWVHMGAYWMDAANTARYPGHDLFNLRAEYMLTENLSIFGRLENVFDKRYADRADYFCSPSVSSCYRYFPGDGRGLYAGATIRF
ncbi:TonB-dependent receptor [Parvibaculum sp.]|uniref:TonB-dependent receptor n=1 Tax=Parvibaculum sp. TaxID=2024848 RepID=UPI00320F57AD